MNLEMNEMQHKFIPTLIFMLCFILHFITKVTSDGGKMQLFILHFIVSVKIRLKSIDISWVRVIKNKFPVFQMSTTNDDQCDSFMVGIKNKLFIHLG